MKTIIVIVALFLYVSARAQDSTEVQYNEEKLAKTYPRWWKKIEIKRKDPFGWIYDKKEWELLMDGQPIKPKYYRDPKRGSNGGYDFA